MDIFFFQQLSTFVFLTWEHVNTSRMNSIHSLLQGICGHKAILKMWRGCQFSRESCFGGRVIFCLQVPMWLPSCRRWQLVIMVVYCLEWRVLWFVWPNHMLCLNNLSETSGGGKKNIRSKEKWRTFLSFSSETKQIGSSLFTFIYEKRPIVQCCATFPWQEMKVRLSKYTAA